MQRLAFEASDQSQDSEANCNVKIQWVRVMEGRTDSTHMAVRDVCIQLHGPAACLVTTADPVLGLWLPVCVHTQG